MTELVFRNMELYFRDRTSVLLSLLAEVIIMVLYIVFMRDNLLESFQGLEKTDAIFDAWMIAGILGITPVTAAMGVYGIMIEDISGKRDRDFVISPLGDLSIMSSYLISAAISAILMSLIVFILSEMYMELMYDEMVGIGNTAKIYSMILINSVCCAAMTILPVMFVKTGNALAGFCTILGALIGFMTGIYLPMGSLGENVSCLIKAFPVSHGVVVFRQLLAEPVIELYMDAGSEAAADFMEYMGVYFVRSGERAAVSDDILILIVSAAVCLTSVMIIRKCRKRR